VSIRQLYRKVPVEKRLCHYCGKPVLSNIDLIDGEIWHHGCINQAGLQPTHRCAECNSLLTPDKINRVNFGDGTKEFRACGLCGSTEIISLRSSMEKIANL